MSVVHRTDLRTVPLNDLLNQLVTDDARVELRTWYHDLMTDTVHTTPRDPIASSLRTRMQQLHGSAEQQEATIPGILVDLMVTRGYVVEGELQMDRLCRDDELHRSTTQLIQRQADVARHVRPESPQGGRKYAGVSHVTSAHLLRSRVAPDERVRMPALPLALAPCAHDSPLANTRVLGVQHLFPTNAVMFNALRTLGLSPEHMTLVGKVGSTNHTVVRALLAEGFRVSELSYFQDARHVQGHDAYAEEVFRALEQFRAEGFSGTLLFLDEGGKWAKAIDKNKSLCRALHDSELHIALIEQTTHGMIVRDRDAIDLPFPTVDVATCAIKRYGEGAMIGEQVVDAALTRAKKAGLAVPRQAVVIGHGGVGSGVAMALLRRGFTLEIYDKHPSADALKRIAENKRQYPERVHQHATLDDALAAHAGCAKLIISSCGVETVTPMDYAKIPSGSLLANGASGNGELGTRGLKPDDLLAGEQRPDMRAGSFTGEFLGNPVHLGDVLAPEYRDRIVALPQGGAIFLLRGGWAINRDVGVPAEYIQLTRILMARGLVQAAQLARSTASGVHVLDSIHQQEAHALVSEFLARRGVFAERPGQPYGPLDLPDFDILPSASLVSTTETTVDRLTECLSARRHPTVSDTLQNYFRLEKVQSLPARVFRYLNMGTLPDFSTELIYELDMKHPDKADRYGRQLEHFVALLEPNGAPRPAGFHLDSSLRDAFGCMPDVYGYLGRAAESVPLLSKFILGCDVHLRVAEHLVTLFATLPSMDVALEPNGITVAWPTEEMRLRTVFGEHWALADQHMRDGDLNVEQIATLLASAVLHWRHQQLKPCFAATTGPQS